MNLKELEKLVKDLREDKLTVAFAESMTAGMLANEFSKITGSYDIFIGSLVVYQPGAKKIILDVKEESMDKYTCESQEVTTEMVYGLKKKLQPEIAAAVTGLASDGGSESENKPVGTVFFSILFKNDLYEFSKIFNSNSAYNKKEERDQIIRSACDFIFAKLREIYEGHKKEKPFKA